MSVYPAECRNFNLKTTITRDGKHFVVSTVHVPYTGFETMVFASNADGKVTSWWDLDCNRYETMAEATEGHTAMCEGFILPAIDVEAVAAA